MPQLPRTARHSRATAACMSSPARGKKRARFHWPTSSNTAPRATADSCIGVLRTGSNSSPRAAPASVPKVTGVYGMRKVVCPTSGTVLPRRAATRPSAFRFEVLPWSVAMPTVV